MADVVECGALTTIALKKCGSSQINRAFSQKTFEAWPDKAPRYITAIRNPGHRLVSCWQHLVKPRHTDRIDPNISHNFGPAMCFPQWVDWVLAQDPESLDQHLRPQTLELADVLHARPAGPIFVAQLEQITDISCGNDAKQMIDFLGRRVCIERKSRRTYAPWPAHFDRVQLQQVRWHFAADWHLWLHLYQTGSRIFDSHSLAKFLDLTNGRHSCMM